MLFYDEIDQFMESAIYDMSVESDLGIYDDDMFEEGVFDKVKGFFQLGTQRSRELDEELKRISVVHAGEGIPSDKSYSTILKVLQVLLKLSVVSDMISIAWGTIASLLGGIVMGSVGLVEGSVATGVVAGVGSMAVALPIYALVGVLSVIIYKLLNKLIKQGLEDDAIRRGSSAISFMKGIRNNVAKRNPAQAKQIDNDIGKIKSLLENPYTESYALEDVDIYSGARGIGLHLTSPQGALRIIRCMQNGTRLINQIEKKGTVDNKLITEIDKHIAISFGIITVTFAGAGVMIGGFSIACALIGWIVALISTLLMVAEGSRFIMKIKSMATNVIDQLNSLIMKTKDPAVKSALIEYKTQIVAALNSSESDSYVDSY